jgi:hypothetical protein
LADKDLTYRLVIKDDGTPTLRRVAAEAESTGAAVTAAQAKEVANQLRAESRLLEERIANARKVEKVAKESADTQSQNLRSAQSELKSANAQALADERAAAKLKEAASKAVGEEVKKTATLQAQAASDVSKNSREIANAAATRVNIEKQLSVAAQDELKSAKSARSAHQEKYNDLKREESAAREASATIVAGDRAVEKAKKDAAKASKEATKETKKHSEEVSSLGRTMERIQRTVAAFVAVWAFQKITSGFSQIIGMGIEYNATLEQSKLGMAAIFTAQGQFVNSSGRALEGTIALNAAMEMSSDITKKLQLDNLQTAATYQQLVKAYQQTVAPGLAVGFDPNQIRQYTLAMVQAASAMGLNLDMLAEETRSMLRGTITPRNTLIATALGLRNEDIRKYKNDTEGLYTFIMSRLSAFGVAGGLAQKTWMGVTSNVKDAIGMVLGESFKPMFEYLKSEMVNVQNNLVKLTPEGMKVNENVIDGFRIVNDLLVNILKLSKEVAMAFTPLQSALTPIATALNFVMDKMTKMISIYYEYKKITDDLLSSVGSKVKSDFVEKEAPKKLGGSIDMPFGDVNYDLKYIANKTGPGKEEAEIAEKIAKINLQIASQNKNYVEQIGLVNILTQAEIVKASAEGKSSVELENALKRQGEQRKKQILIQKEMEGLGWVGEILGAEAAIAGMNGDLQTQIKLERESLEINLLKNRAGLGARDATQIEAENYARMKFDLEAIQKLNVDRLAKELAIISAQTSIADLTGDYKQQAFLIQESNRNKTEELQVTGKLNTEEEKRANALNSIAANYKSNQLIIKGQYDLDMQILGLQKEIADAGGPIENRFSTQRDLIKAAKDYSDQLLASQIALGEATDNPIDPAIIEAIKKLNELFEKLGLFKLQVDTTNELNTVANFYSQVSGFEDVYYAKKLAWIEETRKANEKLYNLDPTDKNNAANVAAEEAKRKLAYETQDLIIRHISDRFDMENKYVNESITNAGKMFDAASTLMKKDTKEYKLMQDFKKAAQIAEMAQEARKNLAIITGYFTRSAAAVATATTQNAANTSTALTGAAASVAAQGSVPFAGFAMAAAMLGFMASVLGMAGIAFGGGGGGGGTSAPVLPPSTVLGAEAGTGSESVANSYELLKDTYDMEYRELSGIYDSMKELNQNITGLVTSIVRTGGVGDFTSAPGSALGNVEEFLIGYNPFNLDSLTSGITDKFDPIGNFISNTITDWITGAWGSVFGGGTSSSVTSSGIQLGGSSVRNLLAGGGMGAQQYADITTYHDGGWFHDDWTSGETQYQNLDSQVTDMLNSVFKNMGETLVELAKGLGINTQAALSYVFAETKINLQGMDTEAINTAISEFISNTADTAVSTLFGPMLRGYQQLNEGLLETAVRLLTDKAVIMNILSMTNKSFVGTTSEAIAFSEAIIAMAGDLDTLTKSAGVYYDKFFTDVEKQTRLQSQLSLALADMGMALPSTRQGYRNLVEGLNLTTVSGQEAYVQMLNLAEVADKYYSALEDVGKAQADLTKSLIDQSKMIADWLSEMDRSSLAPVTSLVAWQSEYDRQKAIASTPEATSQDLSGYLNYAKDYLQFMRTYGGDYQAIYESVTGDVRLLGEAKDIALQQLEATIAADLAAQNAAALQLAATYAAATHLASSYDEQQGLLKILPIGPPTQVLYASGGLLTGPSIMGEAGPEWAVPTYEPQRSRFLASAPSAFWNNLRGREAPVESARSSSEEITLHSHIYLDGKEVAESVAKYIPRNANLSEAIRRVN